jgi:glycosyltransferase involved in cell wall biosynthesis
MTPSPKLRLLWVKAGRLLPVDTGGKLRSFHLARALSSRHDLTMLTFYEGRRDVAYEQAMEAAFPGAVTLRYGPPSNSVVTTALRYGAMFLRPAPFAVTKFTTWRARRLIRRWTAERRFDALICDFLSATLNFDVPEEAATVLFQHNVESALWARQAHHEGNPLLRLIYSIEAAKMRRYETRAVRRFRDIIAVSEHDRDLMSSMVDQSRITVVPTGVDVERFAGLVDQPPKPGCTVFLGSMDWEANMDGVEWMCSEIWPRVLNAVPDARFRIVGRNPHARVRQLASETVEVTGSVPSVERYLADAAAFVVPLRIGGGTRLKIFEAMSAGRAVISTTVGAEGLPVTHDRNILLADDPAAFASAVIRVLQDDDLRIRIARAGLELAREYDWKGVARSFEEVLVRVSQRAGTNRTHGYT